MLTLLKYESCNNQIADALDAYQRAAELDPGNPHIKARLQLLRSGGNSGGPPPAPQPADVHPQAYQAAGPTGPVGPQWGGSAPQPPANVPPPGQSGVGENWARGLSNVNPPPQPPNPYEGREQFRGPPPPPQRQPSPMQEPPMRQPYPEAVRGGPSRRGPSPGPARTNTRMALLRLLLLNPRARLLLTDESPTRTGLDLHRPQPPLRQATQMEPMPRPTAWHLSDRTAALVLTVVVVTTTGCRRPSRLILSTKHRLQPMLTIRRHRSKLPPRVDQLTRRPCPRLRLNAWMTAPPRLAPNACESGRKSPLPRSRQMKRTVRD